jgi:predicted nucleic-acid-binding Zn-ribbon protein
MSKDMQYERLCPTCKVQLIYRGMEDIHTGGRGLEIAEFLASIVLGFSVIPIRDLLVKRTTFDFYVCPKCRYTTFVEEDSNTTGNASTKRNVYIEYKKKLKNVSQLINEIKKVNDF